MPSSAWSESKIALICKVNYSRANWRVSTFFSITDANSWVPVVWLHPPLVFCQHACNFMFTLTHLARWRFHPQWLSHQHPTSHTQPDKVVPLSHCFHILLLLFGCGKSWVIHKLMWFRLRINMTSSLYIVASVLAIPHWSRCEPFPHHCVGDPALTMQCLLIRLRTSFCDMSLDGMGRSAAVSLSEHTTDANSCMPVVWQIKLLLAIQHATCIFTPLGYMFGALH